MTVLHGSSDPSFPALGFNPAPGDVSAVNELADTYHSVGTKLTDANEALAAIVKQEGIWTGSGSDQFARRVGELPEYLIPAERSMTQAANALRDWHANLAQLQKRAHELEEQARKAAEAARQARSNPDLDLANQTFQDEQSLRTAQRLLANAERQLRQAVSDCEQIQQQAQSLLDQHGQLAEQIARALNKAREIAPDDPGLLGDALNAVEDLANEVGNALLDVRDAAWNVIQDNANLIANLSDVVGDIGNALGIVGDVIPPPFGAPVSAVATGLGLAALGGHAVAKTAGADVPPETLTFDAMGAATSLSGLFLPPGGATVAKGASYGLLGGQVLAEVASQFTSEEVATPVDNIQNYWNPQNTAQAVMTGSAALGFTGGPAITAFWNATEQGIAEDNTPDRQIERAEDKVWE